MTKFKTRKDGKVYPVKESGDTKDMKISVDANLTEECDDEKLGFAKEKSADVEKGDSEDIDIDVKVTED